MGQEIIVNGVNVAQCDDYDEFEGLFLCRCENEGMTPYCLENPNCWYKKWKREGVEDEK